MIKKRLISILIAISILLCGMAVAGVITYLISNSFIAECLIFALIIIFCLAILSDVIYDDIKNRR